MARVFETEKTVEMMVNCKTYPAVSKKYIETVCTGGIARDGQFVRLYPIPFRLLAEREQYDRWDVIRVKVYQDTKDTRPESQHIEANTKIEIIGQVKSDRARWDWMRQGVFISTEEMERKGKTNGLVEIVPKELYWEPEEKVWSTNQLEVLTQGNLFHTPEVMHSLALRVPWQFRLKFSEKSTGKEFDRKVLAWSYYQGFRRQLERLGDENKALEAVRDNVYRSILNPDRCSYAIFGTHSRGGNWMISGIYHLPRSAQDAIQPQLF